MTKAVEPYTDEDVRRFAEYVAEREAECHGLPMTLSNGMRINRLLATIEADREELAAAKRETAEATGKALEEAAALFDARANFQERNATRDKHGKWTNGPAMSADAARANASKIRALKTHIAPTATKTSVLGYIAAQAKSALDGKQSLAGALRVIKANAEMHVSGEMTEVSRALKSNHESKEADTALTNAVQRFVEAQHPPDPDINTAWDKAFEARYGESKDTQGGT